MQTSALVVLGEALLITVGGPEAGVSINCSIGTGSGARVLR